MKPWPIDFSISTPQTKELGVKQTRCSRCCSIITSVIEWLSDPLVQISSKHCQSQTKPEELESWYFERMFIPHYVSHVKCHLSPVICNFYLYFFFIFFFIKSHGIHRHWLPWACFGLIWQIKSNGYIGFIWNPCPESFKPRTHYNFIVEQSRKKQWEV